jgi:mycothione reductase
MQHNKIKNAIIMSKKHYDVIVIGAGAGLPKLGRPATNLGLRVALCEKGPLGGTCLNRGCIPSKMLIHPADVALQIDEAPRLDIEPIGGYKVQFSNLVNRVCSVIDEDSNSINPAVENNKLMDWYKQPAKFIAPKTLQIDDHEQEEQKTIITADRIFIAAGGRPRIPDIEGLAGTPFMTSTEALRNPVQPKKLIVIGGGYISTELSHYYAALGTDVTLFVRSQFLGAEDNEIRDEFTKVFSKRKNITVLMKTVPQRIKYENDTFTAFYKDENDKEVTLEADQLLVAIGIVPNTDLLQVEKAGVEVRKDGFIKVNEYLETSQEGVWALGDIAGNFQFRHCANMEGEYLNETVLNVDKSEHGKYPIDYTGMPHAIFSHPQVAGVGMTEEQVKEAGIDYVKGVNPYISSAMGMALRSDYGFVKLLIEKKSRKILGCHIIGPEASALIHEVLPLFRLNGKLDDILYTIHIHPALSELVRNAARKARDALVQSGEKLPFLLTLK